MTYNYNWTWTNLAACISQSEFQARDVYKQHHYHPGWMKAQHLSWPLISQLPETLSSHWLDLTLRLSENQDQGSRSEKIHNSSLIFCRRNICRPFVRLMGRKVNNKILGEPVRGLRGVVARQ